MYKNFNHCLIYLTSFLIVLLIIPCAHSTPPNKISFEELQKAADQGHTEAQFNLGVSYAAGNGVTKDSTKAVELF